MKNKQTNKWINTLGLSGRIKPDLFLSPDDIIGAQHASAMRVGFKELGLAGFFCVNSIPTVAFLIQEQINDAEINKVHRALWNQGLSRLLLVILPDEIHAYSLVQKPVSEDCLNQTLKDHRHIGTFNLLADALKISQLITGIESGRYFQENSERFNEKNRIDSVLLSNLRAAEGLLAGKGLSSDTAQALLLQITFIAYLEDRKIIDADYFKRDLDSNKILSLKELLGSYNPEHLKTLFNRLHNDFNGDMFFAPCSFVASKSIPIILPEQIKCLADFRHGLVEMDTGQMRFWPYDFRYIPVELISAIYDRFLADSEQRRVTGAYYTPRFLADLTINQIWDELPLEVRTMPDFNVLDPACGSAIFLVRIFQRMVEDWRRQHPKKKPSWRTLLSFTSRLHGWDKQANAVRIGIFSLYIALLEEVEPSAIQALFDEGKILPPLFGRTMCNYDFFDENTPDKKFDLIIGNPPWVSRKKDNVASAIKWCSLHDLPMPEKELAWAFVWKGLEHIKTDGLIGFLLPAMGIFLNHKDKTVQARNIWIEKILIAKIINFSDFCFQLFDGAKRPTVLAIYKNKDNNNNRFEYWCPKVDVLFQATRMLTLNSGDKIILNQARLLENPNAWSQYMWMKNRDTKLLGWLSSLSKLGKKLTTFSESKEPGFPSDSIQWIIGQGFQPISSAKDKPKTSEHVTKIPFLDANNFHTWVIPKRRLGNPLQTSSVRRLGFEKGFNPPHVLIPTGIIRKSGLLRAAYSDEKMCFRHAIQAISSSENYAAELKLLTAILNSRFAAWYYFHQTASIGADRALVHEEQLLELPFPNIEELPDSKSAHEAKNAVIKIMDKLLQGKDQALPGEFPSRGTVEKLNQLVYQYYGFTTDEITVIDDTLFYILPSIQPHRNKSVPLWEIPKNPHWHEYMETLISSLKEGLQPGNYLSAALIANHPDLAVLELSIQDVRPQNPYQIIESDDAFKCALNKIHDGLKRPLSQNFQLIPNLRLFVDKSLYLIKPKSMRYWMKSSALNDADDIVGDLFSVKYPNKKLRDQL